LHAHRPLQRTRIRVFNVTGATAAGLTNPASKTRALPAFRFLLARLKREQTVLLTLGEVDVGFVIPMRCQRDGTAVRTHVGQAVGSYLNFVDEVRALGFQRILLATVPPPTIDDWSQWPGPIGHLRKQVTASLAQRSAMAQLFNEMIRHQAPDHGCKMLDVENSFVDDHGLVRPQLISPRPGDLHLANEAASSIYRQALLEAGFA
jgi:hypothetical protein